MHWLLASIIGFVIGGILGYVVVAKVFSISISGDLMMDFGDDRSRPDIWIEFYKDPVRLSEQYRFASFFIKKIRSQK